MILAPFADWWRCFETRSYPGVDATFIHAFDDPDVMAGNGTRSRSNCWKTCPTSTPW